MSRRFEIVMTNSLPPDEWVAIDPGDTTGWAVFTGTQRQPIQMGEWTVDEFMETVAVATYELWVCEDYIIRPKGITHGYEHTWNKGTALRLIGAVELRVIQLGAELKKQQASIKPIAAQKSGVPYTPGKKGTHMFDAVLHGVHYLDKEFPSAPTKVDGLDQDASGPGVRPPTRVAQIDSLGGLRKAGRRAGVEMP
jgi:hypothetical protein